VRNFNANICSIRSQGDKYSHTVTGHHTYLGAYDRVIDKLYVSILKNYRGKVVET